MTLNGVMTVILRFSPNSVALGADCAGLYLSNFNWGVGLFSLLTGPKVVRATIAPHNPPPLVGVKAMLLEIFGKLFLKLQILKQKVRKFMVGITRKTFVCSF